MEPLLTISIPTYRNYQLLRWTLESLIRYTEFPYKVVIVNNGAADDERGRGDREYVEQFLKAIPYNQLSIIHAPKNLGWMDAQNLVLADCKTPFFCCCNDDVTWVPGSRAFWRALVNHFNWDKKAAAVGPGSNFVAGVQSLYQMQADLLTETVLLIGFCCVFRTDRLKEIGGFDASLPGGDDLDWSIRLRQRGYHLIADKSVYLHHHGQSTGKRLYGDGWDSKFMQETINNALIRKHSVEDWYECFGMGWKPVDIDTPAFQDQENVWYDAILERHKGQKGLNLGCGSTRLGDTIGVDARRPGGMGAGGTKLDEVDSDLSAKVEDLPVDSGTIDYICAAHIFEHICDPVAVLREWMRVLRPGGKLYVTCPNEDVYPTIPLDYTHKHAYTPRSVRSLLEITGWDVTSCEAAAFGTIRAEARKPNWAGGRP